MFVFIQDQLLAGSATTMSSDGRTGVTVVPARKADGRSDLAKQLAAEKMATAAMRALDEPEPEGPFFDLVYNSIRGALLNEADSSTALTAAAAACMSAPMTLETSSVVSSQDVEVIVEQTTR